MIKLPEHEPMWQDHFVAVDETYWSPTFQLIGGLHLDDKKLKIVGGSWSEQEDLSELPIGSSVDMSKLSRMTLDVLVSRADSSHKKYPHKYSVMMVPVAPAKDKSKCELFFSLVGRTMQALTEANSGIPPLGFAIDGGTCNAKLLAAGLGLLPAEELAAGGTFWAACSVSPVKAPFFPFGILRYGSSPVLCSLDANHCLKRFTIHHLLGQKTVQWGDMFCDLSGMLKQGLPLSSFTVHDSQSDKQCYVRLNPRYLTSGTLDAGCHIMNLVASLINRAWESWFA